MGPLNKLLPEDLTNVGGFLKKINWIFIVIFAIFSLTLVSLIISDGGMINYIFLILFIIPTIVLLFNNKVISDRVEGFDRYYCNHCKDHFYAHKPRSKDRGDVYCSDCGTKLNTPQDFIKGRKFEQSVKERFERSEGFEIISETPRYEDKNTHAKKFPDLNVEAFNGDKFFIEVKYRESPYNTELKNIIRKNLQLERFEEFKEDSGKEVYYFIGIRGQPENPDEVFVVPVEQLKLHRSKNRDLNYLRDKNYKIDLNKNAYYKVDEENDRKILR